MKMIALKAGALGFSISGSGPSMFCFVQNKVDSSIIIERAKDLYGKSGINIISFVSRINNMGVQTLD